jgi:hypothetical protein
VALNFVKDSYWFLCAETLKKGYSLETKVARTVVKKRLRLKDKMCSVTIKLVIQAEFRIQIRIRIRIQAGQWIRIQEDKNDP